MQGLNKSKLGFTKRFIREEMHLVHFAGLMNKVDAQCKLKFLRLGKPNVEPLRKHCQRREHLHNITLSVHLSLLITYKTIFLRNQSRLPLL